jgi:LPS-assembly lipoprotein
VRGWRPAALVVAAAFTLASSLALSACGFRLQGQLEVSSLFARTYIDAPVDQPLLKRQLAEALERSGASVQDRAEGASAIVRIRDARSEQRVLSVSAQGRPREYEVVYRVRFEVLQDKSPALPLTELELRRDYPFDESDVLARQREAGVLLAEMQREMAKLIHRRLAAVAAPR